MIGFRSRLWQKPQHIARECRALLAAQGLEECGCEKWLWKAAAAAAPAQPLIFFPIVWYASTTLKKSVNQRIYLICRASFNYFQPIVWFTFINYSNFAGLRLLDPVAGVCMTASANYGGWRMKTKFNKVALEQSSFSFFLGARIDLFVIGRHGWLFDGCGIRRHQSGKASVTPILRSCVTGRNILC